MSLWEKAEHFIHYKAPKYVEIRSLNLGLVSKLPLVLVFIYIFVYQIGYENKHLEMSRLAGFGRMQLQRPTKDHCNPNHADCLADFTPSSQLHYCLPNITNTSKTPVHGDKLPCGYLDEKTMNPAGFQHFTTIIPTRITRVKQQATGNCGPNSKVECTNVYNFTEGEETSIYVADVERFTLLIETAFTLPPEDLSKTPVRRGASNNFPGYWEVCADPRRHTGCELEKIPCVVGHCDGGSASQDDRRRRLRGSPTTEDTVQAARRRLRDDDEKPHFFGLPFGDVIPVGELLKIAGVDLDVDTDAHGEKRRSTGIALQIDVDYSNKRRFNWPPWSFSGDSIKYVYRVSKLPFQTYKEVSEELLENGDRVLIDKHGIFVNVNIEGSICYWDFTQLLLILTTGLSLVAGTDAAVHFFASYIWRHKEEYHMDKNDRSRNYDKDEHFCFCFNIPSHRKSHHQKDHDWPHWSQNPKDFTRSLRALDGDTIIAAGELLMSLHRMKSTELGDPDFVRKEKDQWELEFESRKSSIDSAPEATASAPLMCSG